MGIKNKFIETKNKLLSKLTVAGVSRTLGITIFVLAFLFTFLYCFEFKEQWIILIAVFGSLIALIGIIWLVLVLLIKRHNRIHDVNQQKIDKALDKLEEQAKEESKSLDEQSNN